MYASFFKKMRFAIWQMIIALILDLFTFLFTCQTNWYSCKLNSHFAYRVLKNSLPELANSLGINSNYIYNFSI